MGEEQHQNLSSVTWWILTAGQPAKPKTSVWPLNLKLASNFKLFSIIYLLASNIFSRDVYIFIVLGKNDNSDVVRFYKQVYIAFIF